MLPCSIPSPILVIDFPSPKFDSLPDAMVQFGRAKPGGDSSQVRKVDWVRANYSRCPMCFGVLLKGWPL